MIDPWILFFSVVTVVATIWMGFRSARTSKSASDFFVAGRSVSVGWNASAISGEYLSAASFMGVAGMVMSAGYDALWYPVCYACGYLFLLLFIAGPLRRFGAYTIPDFAEGRYDSPVFRKIAVIFVLFIGFFYTMPQMKGAGTTLAYVFKDITFFGQRGLPYWVGVVVVGAVITLNVALGGMKGITLIQAFQYWIKMFAISVPIFVLASVYGGYGSQLGLNSALPLSASDSASLNGDGAITFDPEAFPTEFAKETSETSYANLSGEAKAKAIRLGFGRTTLSLPTPTCDTMMALQAYVDLRLSFSDRFTNYIGKDVLQARMQTLDTRQVPKPPTSASANEFRRYLERLFATNGLTLAYVNRDAAALVLTSNLGRFIPVEPTSNPTSRREPRRLDLPAKAPADDIWLNPFGPLTTKAAKAANRSTEAARPFALLYTYSLIIALVCGTAGLPHILVRFYTNPDGVAAKRTTMWVMILIGVFYVFPPVFGVMGRNLMPSLYEGVGVNGTDGIVLKLPTVLRDRFGVLGSILSGIACAGAFAAFMSTFSGLLVSMTGALAHDVYGRILRPQSTPAQRMRMFKVAAVVIGAVAILLGTLVENFEINFMVGQAFAIAAASYFPLLFMSVWWRGMTVRGAATGMLTGGLLAVAAISLTSWTTFLTAQAAKFKALGQVEPGWFATLKPYSLTGFWADHPLLRILGEQPAIWAVPLAITLMIVVSKLTRHTVPADIREKMLVLHAPEALGLRQDYIRDQEAAH